jgi:hypothetical protein
MRVRPGLLVAASLGLVAASALAAAGRALALASVMPGERSLLFRWHYLQTAWSAWREHPLIGTGPEGFKDASARLRPMDAVEIVQSAHAAFADWMAQLGVASVAWIGAAVAMLVWSARGAAMEPTPLPAPESRDGLAQRITMLAVLVAMAFSLQAEIHTLDATSLMVRLVGGIAWAGTAVTLMPRLWSARSCGAHMLFPAALVMLCQGQVEMTLWNPGSCAWLLVMLGAAVPPHALQPDAEELRRTPRMTWRVTAASAAGLACLVCALGWSAHRRMESALGGAAAQLLPFRRNPEHPTPTVFSGPKCPQLRDPDQFVISTSYPKHERASQRLPLALQQPCLAETASPCAKAAPGAPRETTSHDVLKRLALTKCPKYMMQVLWDTEKLWVERQTLRQMFAVIEVGKVAMAAWRNGDGGKNERKAWDDALAKLEEQ